MHCRTAVRATGRSLDRAGQGIADVIHRETGGNPFFVEEFAHHLLDTGAVAFHRDGWQVDPSISTPSVPDAVRDAVRRRVERLPCEAATVLAWAAVLGAEFELATLAALIDTPRDALEEVLDAATASGLVREVAAERYVFAHALVRQALYDALSATRRRRWHLEAADLLASRAPDERAAAIANHLLNAGPAVDAARVIDACILAGNRSRALLAWEEAVTHWSTAAELLTAAAGMRPKLASVLERIGDALLTTEASEPGIDQLERALALYDELGDLTAAARVRIRIARNLSFGSSRLQLARAFDHVERAIEVLEPGGDSASLAFAHTVRSSASWYAMRVRDGVDSGERAVAIATALGDKAAATNARSVLGTNLFNAGRIAEGVDLMLAGVEHAVGARQQWSSVKQTAEHCNLLMDPAPGLAALDAELASGRHDKRPHTSADAP